MNDSDPDKSLVSTLKVTNRFGLHTRPSAMIFKFTQSYPDRIYFIKGNQRANAKSLDEILMLGASPNTVLTVEIIGLNAAKILRGLQDLFESKFGEDGD